MYLTNQTTALRMAWTTVVKSYQTGMQAYFDTYIMQPQVLDTLGKAYGSSDETVRAEQRAMLYRFLYPVYQKLQARDVRQLHFHTPEGRSFLRFHAPHHSGDALNDSRPSVMTALRDHKVVQGFETGRVVAGFRNVFPIIHNGEELGSVELSQPFEALRKEMRELDHSNEFMLAYKASLVLPKLIEEQKKVYAPSLFSPDWLVEDPKQKLPDSPPVLSDSVLKIYGDLAASSAFHEALVCGEPVSLSHQAQEGYYRITLLPLIDLVGLPAAVLIAVAPAPEIDNFNYNFYLNLLVFSAMLSLGVVGLLLLLENKQAIAEKQSHLQLMANTMNDGLYVVDTSGAITFVNDTASEILGYSRNELMGHNAHELFHHRNPLTECHICQSLQQASSFIGEEEFFREDGTPFIAEVTSEPMFKNDRPINMVTLFRDISERKQTAAMLQEAHDKLDLLSNNIETQIWSMVTPDTYGAVNRAHAEFCGYSPADMEHKSLFQLFPQKAAETFLQNYQAVFRNKTQVHLEIRIRNAQGARRLLLMVMTSKLGSDGRVEYVICSGEDITERKRLEEQLRQLCNTDHLTKAFNRRYFVHVLEAEVQRSKRYATPFTLVMCDVDYFKKINDIFGHEIGDKVLVRIVAAIHERVRSADVFARWGGEEFVLLLANTPLASAVPLVENIRETIGLLEFGEVGGVTISFGVTAWQEGDSIDSLLNRADKLLYEAKEAGRNCVRFSE